MKTYEEIRAYLADPPLVKIGHEKPKRAAWTMTGVFRSFDVGFSDVFRNVFRASGGIQEMARWATYNPRSYAAAMTKIQTVPGLLEKLAEWSADIEVTYPPPVEKPPPVEEWTFDDFMTNRCKMMEIGRPKNPVNSVPKIPTDSVKRKRNSKRKPEPQPEPEPTFWTAEDFAAGGCGAQDVGKPRPPLATSPWGTDVNDPALRRMLHYQGGVKELVRWGYRNPTEFYTFVVPLIRDEVQAALAAAYPQE